MGAMFDTADHAAPLQRAGVPAAQAAAHTQALAASLQQALGALATGVALKEVELALRAEIHEVEARLRAEIRVVETNLRAEIGALGHALRAEIGAAEARLRGELREARGATETALAGVRERLQLLQWMVGVLVAGVGGLLLRAYV